MRFWKELVRTGGNGVVLKAHCGKQNEHLWVGRIRQVPQRYGQGEPTLRWYLFSNRRCLVTRSRSLKRNTCLTLRWLRRITFDPSMSNREPHPWNTREGTTRFYVALLRVRVTGKQRKRPISCHTKAPPPNLPTKCAEEVVRGFGGRAVRVCGGWPGSVRRYAVLGWPPL